LQAIAVESALDIDVFEMFNTLGGTIPVLSAVRPNGDESIENFEAAGGCRALMKQLEPLLDTKAMTCAGTSVVQNLAGVTVANSEVIRPPDRAFSNEAPISILRGSLAPESAICKLGLRGPGRISKFDGPAIVFDNGPDAIAAVRRGDIRPGQVLVVRGMGPKGGPGMAGPASMVVFAVDSAGLQNEIAFISDGQLSGLCNKGLTVAEVSPESAIGGPLALVKSGDRIVIDVDRHLLDLMVPEAELAARRQELGPPRLPHAGGWLGIYQRSVQPMSTGAVLVERK
jgi:dihydroxy-acid dehydratase